MDDDDCAETIWYKRDFKPTREFSDRPNIAYPFKGLQKKKKKHLLHLSCFVQWQFFTSELL